MIKVLEEPASIRIFQPRSAAIELLLTAQTPLSHHDPAVQDNTNQQLFNRAKKILPVPELSRFPEAFELEQITAFLQTQRVPADMGRPFTMLTLPAFVGAALIRFFADVYNRGEGAGIFEGMTRWDRLFARVRTAATRSYSLIEFWGVLCRDLQVPPPVSFRDQELLMFFSLPMSLQNAAVREILRNYTPICSIARAWHTAAKSTRKAALGNRLAPDTSGMNSATADAIRRYRDALEEGSLSDEETHQAEERIQELLNGNALNISDFQGGSRAFAEVDSIDLPAVSANTLRHQVVRAPGWLHLCMALGFSEAMPGQGELPPSVEAIFANGGNIASGVKQPSDPFSKANRARANYPLLDLVGGTTSSFDVGESRLKVAGWLICSENREALAGSEAYDHPNASLSVFDMLDEVTETRQATVNGVGQMIRNFESLIPGVAILCRMYLTPFTQPLTRGALMAAIHAFEDTTPVVGGQSARGYGFVDVQNLTENPEMLQDLEKYEGYLDQNKEQLRGWMVDGTLGTGSKILS